jgi:hypothetical protein
VNGEQATSNSATSPFDNVHCFLFTVHRSQAEVFMSQLYHGGNRALQDRFDTRRLADRLEAVKVHDRNPRHVLSGHRESRGLAHLFL